MDGGGWSAPRPGHFTPQKRVGVHCAGNWVGPRAGLDGCGELKVFETHRGSNPDYVEEYQVRIIYHKR